MAKKSVKAKNLTTKYYLYSLITLFIAVGFCFFSKIYPSEKFSSAKTKSDGSTSVTKMEQTIAIDKTDYSKLDASICMLKKVLQNNFLTRFDVNC